MGLRIRSRAAARGFAVVLAAGIIAGTVLLKPTETATVDDSLVRAGALPEETGPGALRAVSDLASNQRSAPQVGASESVSAAEQTSESASDPTGPRLRITWADPVIVAPYSLRLGVRYAAESGGSAGGGGPSTSAHESGSARTIDLEPLLSHAHRKGLTPETITVWASSDSFTSAKETFAYVGPKEYHVVLRTEPLGGEDALTVRVPIAEDESLDGRATVGIWPMDNGKPESAAIKRTTVIPGGTLRAELPHPGSYLLVAWHRTRAPSWRVFEIGSETQLLRLAPVTLATGHEVRGQFVNGGKPMDRTVHFDLRTGSQGMPLYNSRDSTGQGARTELSWIGGNVAKTGGSFRSEDDGRFLIGGLDPGARTLQVKGVEELDLSTAAGPPFEWPIVAAPSDGQDLTVDLGSATVRVTVSSTRANVRGRGRLLVQRETAQPYEVKITEKSLRGASATELNTWPKEDVRLHLVVPGAMPVTREIKAPAAGEVLDVELSVEPKKPDSSLRIIVPEESRRGGAAYIVYLLPMDGLFDTTDEMVLRLGKPHHCGRFEDAIDLGFLPPGRYRFAIHRGHSPHRRPSTSLDAVGEVTLTPGQTTQVEVSFAEGGRLSVGFRDKYGEWSSVPCRITGPGGEDKGASFTPSDRNFTAPPPGMLAACRVNWAAPNLPAGTYTVTAEGRSQTVVIRAGETAAVTFEQ